MHLRFAGRLIWTIAVVPIAFFAVLTAALFPDFVSSARPPEPTGAPSIISSVSASASAGGSRGLPLS
jgi:hypothetical protein